MFQTVGWCGNNRAMRGVDPDWPNFGADVAAARKRSSVLRTSAQHDERVVPVSELVALIDVLGSQVDDLEEELSRERSSRGRIGDLEARLGEVEAELQTFRHAHSELGGTVFDLRADHLAKVEEATQNTVEMLEVLADTHEVMGSMRSASVQTADEVAVLTGRLDEIVATAHAELSAVERRQCANDGRMEALERLISGLQDRALEERSSGPSQQGVLDAIGEVKRVFADLRLEVEADRARLDVRDARVDEIDARLALDGAELKGQQVQSQQALLELRSVLGGLQTAAAESKAIAEEARRLSTTAADKADVAASTADALKAEFDDDRAARRKGTFASAAQVAERFSNRERDLPSSAQIRPVPLRAPRLWQFDRRFRPDSPQLEGDAHGRGGFDD